MENLIRIRTCIRKYLKEFPLIHHGKVNDLFLLYNFCLWSEDNGINCFIAQIANSYNLRTTAGIKSDSTVFPVIYGHVIIFKVKDKKIWFDAVPLDHLVEENPEEIRVLGDFLHLSPEWGNLYLETTTVKSKGKTFLEVEHNIRVKIIEECFKCYWERFVYPLKTDTTEYHLIKGESEDECPETGREILSKRFYIQTKEIPPIVIDLAKPKTISQIFLDWIKF